MSDVLIRKAGHAGRITLNRPQALNALTWEMCTAMEAALDAWREDPDIRLVVIDGAGEKAFCAGGDIAEMYRTGRNGDFGYGRRFFTAEYRLDAKVAEFPKPYVAFMQGYTMGGGVGVSCHGSHRVVGTTTRIAMPECGIGLIPDVGGTYLLSRAPGYLGEYLGTTGYRMGPGDALLSGFADLHVPEDDWPDLIADLERSGETDAIDRAARPAPEAPLEADLAAIDRHFSLASLRAAAASLGADDTSFGQSARDALGRQSPLSAACAFEAVRRVRGTSIREALATEFRFTSRAAEHGDFIEGIRATIIDRDKSPRWRHATIDDVTPAEITAMLAPLGPEELRL